jgi:two-component system phosphate regulon sensor histidine kinase PhoR
MARRSIGFPLALGIVLSLMTAALAVGWQVLIVGDLPTVTEGLTTLHWVLIVLGSAFFVLLIVGLVWLCTWLVREMRLNQRQQAFLDAVTHEMKTPLASLRLYVETLARRDPEPERRQAFLERMEEDVERLEHTVEQVLAAARTEARIRAPAERFDLSELLGACALEARQRHSLGDEAVRLQAPPGLSAWGNRVELMVVFRNLLENAIKYSPSPVEVTVRAEAAGDDRVRVVIEDRGIGIERKELRKIFQRFYRAGRDVQRQAAGLGLGLFIVRNLVRRQGGRVEASSEGSGQGSRFLVTLRTSPRGETPQTGAVPARAARAS